MKSSNIKPHNHTIAEDNFDLKNEFFRYLFFWKYFIFSILFFLLVGLLYLRYTDKVYESTALIKILDKKDYALEMPSAEDLFSNSKINLENEIAVLTSYPIIEKVALKQKLYFHVEAVGKVKSSLIIDYPFELSLKIPAKELSLMSLSVNVRDDGLLIQNIDTQKEYFFNSFKTSNTQHDLPFEIVNLNKLKFNDDGYILSIYPLENVYRKLRKDINVSQFGKESHIISLNIISSNSKYGRNILNELIEVFNNDGIADRQLVHKRTIDFVNSRYIFLSSELDSIELNKKDFKTENNLIDFVANSTISLEKSSRSDEEIFSNSNQIFIISSLLDDMSDAEHDLLPTNIGIENLMINSLISSYNSAILQQKKLISNAGPNNPSAIQLKNVIDDTKTNIISSLKNYLSQLNIIKNNLSNQSADINKSVSNLPQQERMLRVIERNQKIKESLYLFLLQRGEEAQVSYAITEPSIKVIEYAMTSNKPVHPRSLQVLIILIILSILIPFTIIYLIFYFDNKIHSREDLENYSLNVIGEIPFFDLSESEKVFTNPDDRSIISESFRMLMSNVRYLQNNDSKSNVILVTSSIKGEGKTLNALNLALSFSSVSKKVLLIGCDLRNPQLHKYINYDKNVKGLVDFLVDKKTEWKKNIINPFDRQPLDILLSGPLPPNPLSLINNGNIDVLLEDARKVYDYIIIDSAPTLLVADTQSLMNKSDVLIFLTRCNITDNDVLSHIRKVSEDSEANVGIILNGVGQKNSYGYSYGYRYGYGYNYKYSYNYGYGYGYSSDDEKS